MVRVDNGRSGCVSIEKGVRQGCVLSPHLFSLFTQLVKNELSELDGIIFGGRNVNEIMYANDMDLLVDIEKKAAATLGRIE